MKMDSAQCNPSMHIVCSFIMQKAFQAMWYTCTHFMLVVSTDPAGQSGAKQNICIMDHGNVDKCTPNIVFLSSVFCFPFLVLVLFYQLVLTNYRHQYPNVSQKRWTLDLCFFELSFF